METKHGGRFETAIQKSGAEEPLLEHQPGSFGTAKFVSPQAVSKKPLFGRLKDEHHVARQAGLHPGQYRGHAHQHGGMGIMPAHLSDTVSFALEGQIIGLGNTGDASISARNATVRPGRPPSRMPTTPVPATSVIT